MSSRPSKLQTYRKEPVTHSFRKPPATNRVSYPDVEYCWPVRNIMSNLQIVRGFESSLDRQWVGSSISTRRQGHPKQRAPRLSKAGVICNRRPAAVASSGYFNTHAFQYRPLSARLSVPEDLSVSTRTESRQIQLGQKVVQTPNRCGLNPIGHFHDRSQLRASSSLFLRSGEMRPP